MSAIGPTSKSDYSEFFEKIKEKSDSGAGVSNNKTIRDVITKNLLSIASLKSAVIDEKNGVTIRKKANVIFSDRGDIVVESGLMKGVKGFAKKSVEKLRTVAFQTGIFPNSSRDMANVEKFSNFALEHIKNHPPSKKKDAEELSTAFNAALHTIRLYGSELDRSISELKAKDPKNSQIVEKTDLRKTMEVAEARFLEAFQVLADQAKQATASGGPQKFLQRRIDEQVEYYQNLVTITKDDAGKKVFDYSEKDCTNFATWIADNSPNLLEMQDKNGELAGFYKEQPFADNIEMISNLDFMEPFIGPDPQYMTPAMRTQSENIINTLLSEMIMRGMSKDEGNAIITKLNNNQKSTLSPDQKLKVQKKILKENFPVTDSLIKKHEDQVKAGKIKERDDLRTYRHKRAKMFKGAVKIAGGVVAAGIGTAMIFLTKDKTQALNTALAGLRTSGLGLSELVRNNQINGDEAKFFDELIRNSESNPLDLIKQIGDFYSAEQEDPMVKDVAAALLEAKKSLPPL